MNKYGMTLRNCILKTIHYFRGQMLVRGYVFSEWAAKGPQLGGTSICSSRSTKVTYQRGSHQGHLSADGAGPAGQVSTLMWCFTYRKNMKT